MSNIVVTNGKISAVKLVTSESITTPTLTADNSLIYKGKELADILDESAAGSNGPFVKLEGGNEITGNQTITGELTVTEDSESSGYPGQLYFSGIPTEMLSDAVYDLGVLNENKDLSGIRFVDISTHVQTCEIWFSIGDEAHDIYWPENMLWLDSTDGNAPAIVVRTEYRVAIRKEANGSMVASIAYAVGEGQQSVDEIIRGAAQKDGDNTFIGANTFTGAVNMSGASVTPPEGWNVGELTPEAIQQVVPMKWRDNRTQFGTNATTNGEFTTAIGDNSSVNYRGTAIGSYSRAFDGSFAGGHYATASGLFSIAVGFYANSTKINTITVGQKFTETTPDGNVTHTCTTEGTGSITIGAGANTLNNGDTESSNSVTIGCKASNQGADSVVIGAQASCGLNGSVVIGAGANTTTGASVTIGRNSRALNNGVRVGAGGDCYAESVSIGCNTIAHYYATAIGRAANAKNSYCVAIGPSASVSDYGATVIRSTAQDGTYTQLYFSGANTPLANKYFPTAWEQKQDVDEQGNPKVDENGDPVMVDDKDKPIAGAAMMGFVAKDKDGNIIARGANMLSALFPYYTGAEDDPFAPTTMSLRPGDEPQEVMAFHPSDLDMPVEEPTEPEEYTPLPVYPIVEPEIEEL